MATAGFERGLMLRSPARFQETARKLVALYRENDASAPTRPARGGRALLDGRRGLRARHLPHRVAAARRRQDRRRGEPQQDLLVRARPAHARDRAAHPRPPRRAAARGARCAAASATGSTATCSRSPARSTPAPTRSSATSSPSASSACRGACRCASPSATISCCSRAPCATSSTKECTPERGARALGRPRPAARRDAVEQARRARACSALLRARGARRPGPRRASTSCCCSRRPAARRCPSRSSRPPRSARRCCATLGDAALADALAAARRRGRRDRRGRASRRTRSSPTRTSRICCCSRTATRCTRSTRRGDARAPARQRSRAPALPRRVDAVGGDAHRVAATRARALLAAALDRGALACAAQPLGVAEQLIDLAVGVREAARAVRPRRSARSRRSSTCSPT